MGQEVLPAAAGDREEGSDLAIRTAERLVQVVDEGRGFPVFYCYSL